MRVVSGKFKGRVFYPPKNLPVRPTSDIAKEALFNILANRIRFAETQALDLFSGTGNLSFELASRGCTAITAVDQDAGCIQYIQKIVKEWELPIHCIKAEALGFLNRSTTHYDLIIADPPYEWETSQLTALVNCVIESNKLSGHGLLIIEHYSKKIMDSIPSFLMKKSYGGTTFSFFTSLSN